MPASDHVGSQFDPVRYINDPSTPEVIKGADARRVMKAANIRSWPIEDDIADKHMLSGGVGAPDRERVMYSTETLHTRQGHLHVPTLRKYMAGETPEHDPDYSLPGDPVAYHPEVAHVPGRAERWVYEGHHRIVASRLRGDRDMRVWRSDTVGQF